MRDVQTKFFPTLIDSYKLWPAAHIVNFAFVPSHLRILYVNIIAVSLISISINKHSLFLGCLVCNLDSMHARESADGQVFNRVGLNKKFTGSKAVAFMKIQLFCHQCEGLEGHEKIYSPRIFFINHSVGFFRIGLYSNSFHSDTKSCWYLLVV